MGICFSGSTGGDNKVSQCIFSIPDFFKRVKHRELGPLLYDREKKLIVREIIPIKTWIENGIMYSKPMDVIDKTKFVRKLLKSENITSEHENNTYASSKKIPEFIDFHNINMSDFISENPYEYATFNDFFIREIKSEKRPIAEPENDDVIVSAADCRISVFDSVSQAHALFIKGKNFDLKDLISGRALDADREKVDFLLSWVNDDMAMVNFRLAPMDYHRFHSPVSGKVTMLYHIPGEYFTVEPFALKSDISVLSANARSIMCIKTETHGRVLFIPIGAEVVGKQNMLVKEGDSLDKGQEVGYFDYGGSDIIAVFENPVIWDSDIYNMAHGGHTSDVGAEQDGCIETLIHVNDSIGTFRMNT